MLDGVVSHDLPSAQLGERARSTERCRSRLAQRCPSGSRRRADRPDDTALGGGGLRRWPWRESIGGFVGVAAAQLRARSGRTRWDADPPELCRLIATRSRLRWISLDASDAGRVCGAASCRRTGAIAPSLCRRHDASHFPLRIELLGLQTRVSRGDDAIRHRRRSPVGRAAWPGCTAHREGRCDDRDEWGGSGGQAPARRPLTRITAGFLGGVSGAARCSRRAGSARRSSSRERSPER